MSIAPQAQRFPQKILGLQTLAPKSIDLQEDEERLGLALQSWVILFDLPIMQHPATDHLHIKVAHAECPLAGFTLQEIEHSIAKSSAPQITESRGLMNKPEAIDTVPI